MQHHACQAKTGQCIGWHFKIYYSAADAWLKIKSIKRFHGYAAFNHVKTERAKLKRQKVAIYIVCFY